MDINNHVSRGVAVLISGQPLIFPTDTVYGLGVAVGIAPTPELLYSVKERDSGKPIAWLVSRSESLNLYGRNVPAYAFALAEKFWPGPLTIVVLADSMVREPFMAPDKTIALRMPASETALALIEGAGVPLATTSANISGQEPPQDFAKIDPRLLSRVEMALRDDAPKTGVSSTVVDCTSEKPQIIREGEISAAAIFEVLAGMEE